MVVVVIVVIAVYAYVCVYVYMFVDVCAHAGEYVAPVREHGRVRANTI